MRPVTLSTGTDRLCRRRAHAGRMRLLPRLRQNGERDVPGTVWAVRTMCRGLSVYDVTETGRGDQQAR